MSSCFSRLFSVSRALGLNEYHKPGFQAGFYFDKLEALEYAALHRRKDPQSKANFCEKGLRNNREPELTARSNA